MNTAINKLHGNKLTLDYLLEQLVDEGILSSQQVSQFHSQQRDDENSDDHPLLVIANQGWQSVTSPPFPISLEQLTRWLAKHCNQEYFRIDPLKVDVEKITGVVSQAYASKLRILPVHVTENEITVATCEPFVNDWETEFARISKKKIKRVVINPTDLDRYIIEFYGVSRNIIGAANSDMATAPSAIQNFEQLVEVGKMGEPDANDRHVVSLVDWLLQFAFEQRASDIHLEPRRDIGKVRFRIDGKLHNVHEVPIVLMGAITSRLKSLGRMDVTDKRRPQDGRVKTKTPTGGEVEMRLSTMPTTFGEKLVLRIFDPDLLLKDFSELGFTKHDRDTWEHMIDHPHGIILVTGPTGSGKTTTLYSSLKYLSRPELNICTIEDPIELVEPQFNQMQVETKIDVDFATGVRTLLRQDPDIIMVGEIRDKETADVAIQAALTGHLVLSSLHTNSAPASITRLLDIGAQPYLIASTLLGVMAQRLIRTLCPYCKKEGELDKTVWEQLVAPAKAKIPKTVYLPTGCDECRFTGYLGRMGIYEAMFIDEKIRQLINTTKDIAKYRNTAIKQGLRTLQISGAQKIAEGVTTLEEIYNVVPPPKSDAG